jgi:hypothetical protein
MSEPEWLRCAPAILRRSDNILNSGAYTIDLKYRQAGSLGTRTFFPSARIIQPLPETARGIFAPARAFGGLATEVQAAAARGRGLGPRLADHATGLSGAIARLQVRLARGAAGK